MIWMYSKWTSCHAQRMRIQHQNLLRQTTGIAWHILSPRFSAYSWIGSHPKLTPVQNSIHNSSRSNLWKRLIGISTMSVSTVFNYTLQCPVAKKSFRCKNIIVSTSSWLHGEKRSMQPCLNYLTKTLPNPEPWVCFPSQILLNHFLFLSLCLLLSLKEIICQTLHPDVEHIPH